MAAWPAIAEIARKVQAGELKAADLVERSLKAIADKQEYHAILWTLEDRARERAAEIDRKIADGEQIGRLAGVPFIAKDNFLVFGSETRAASNILKRFEAPYQATAIDKLEAEGAICVAKANMDAFAHGTTTENSDFGATSNPHDIDRIPGGSSGGSAAAVVLELAPFALGTDTGGSIRQPASMSGCVGLKPTYGLVSRSGVVAMASSLDVIGPLAMTVDDAALVLDVMAGRDTLDSTSIEREAAGYADLSGDITGKKIAIIAEYMGEGLQPEVKRTVEAAVEKLRAAGAEVSTVSIPSIDMALAAYYIICPAEVSSNLSRYDGQRYGYSVDDAGSLEASYTGARGTGFGREAKRRIMIGTYVLSSGYYDAYYRRAQTVRTKIINEFNKAFAEYDYLVGPVAPSTAFKLGEKIGDPLQLYLEDVLTVAVNLVGIPAISIPCGEADGLPVGMQIMAPQRQDRALLSLAKQAEAII